METALFKENWRGTLRKLWLIPAFLIAANLHAGIIVLKESDITLEIGSNSGGGSTQASGVLNYSPSGNLTLNPNWTYTASLLTNLVDQGSGLAAANGFLSLRLTDVTLQCVNQSGCADNAIDFGVFAGFDLGDPYAAYTYSLDGSGPDVRFLVFPNLPFPNLNQPVQGPNYSFTQSGAVAPSTNALHIEGELDLIAGAYAFGTTVTLPHSLDITLFATPEPATISLLAMGLGICGWRFRNRRRSRS